MGSRSCGPAPCQSLGARRRKRRREIQRREIQRREERGGRREKGRERSDGVHLQGRSLGRQRPGLTTKEGKKETT
jgi:hypothetical protein